MLSLTRTTAGYGHAQQIRLVAVGAARVTLVIWRSSIDADRFTHP